MGTENVVVGGVDMFMCPEVAGGECGGCIGPLMLEPEAIGKYRFRSASQYIPGRSRGMFTIACNINQ